MSVLNQRGRGISSTPNDKNSNIIEKEYKLKSYNLLVELLDYNKTSIPGALFIKLTSLSKLPYSYKDIYDTIKFLENEIREQAGADVFNDDMHRINYVIKMIRDEVNFVYERNANIDVIERLNDEDYKNFSIMMQNDNQFITKYHAKPVPDAVKKMRERLKDIW